MSYDSYNESYIQSYINTYENIQITNFKIQNRGSDFAYF